MSGERDGEAGGYGIGEREGEGMERLGQERDGGRWGRYGLGDRESGEGWRLAGGDGMG